MRRIARAHPRLLASGPRRRLLHTARARVACHARLHVTSDGPATTRLSGCARTVSVPGAGSEVAR